MNNSTKSTWPTRVVMALFVVVWAALLVGCEISRPDSAPSEPLPPEPPLEESQPAAGSETAPVGLEPSDLLVDQVWVLVGYGDAANPTVVAEGTVVTAVFGSDGSLAGAGGCNNYSLRYELGEGDRLIVRGPVMSTMMVCPLGMEQEQTYLAALQTVESYRITEEGRLEVSYSTGAGYDEKLIYAPGQTPLAATQWLLLSYGNPDEPQPVEAGTTITAIFSTDAEPPSGLVSGSAGCNSYSAAYTTDGVQMSIRPPVSTLKSCPLGLAQEQIYLEALVAAEGYQIAGQRLEISYAGGAGLLTFTSAHLPLEQTLWTLVSFGNQPVGAGIEITALFEPRLEDEEKGRLIEWGFLDDEDEPTGAVAGSAGCNQYSAAYSTAGEALTVELPLTSRMICPPGVEQEQRYLDALQQADSYRILGDQLEIAYGQGTGVLNFVANRTPLEGTYWALISYGPVEQPRGLLEETEITALFERPQDAPSGLVAGTTGCNEYEATYTANVNEIKVNLPTTTRQSCGDAVAEQEQAYFLGLNSAGNYHILGNELQIPYDQNRQALTYIATQPPVAPPAAVIQAPSEANVGELITFDGGQSRAENPIDLYLWDFGDGSQAGARSIGHSFGRAGDYNVTLTVVDRAGLGDSTTHRIRINETPDLPPTAVIEGPAVARVGEAVAFQGGNSIPGNSPIVVYAWNFGNTRTFGDSPDVSTTTVYDKPGVYQVSLTVTDQNGMSDSASLQLVIYDAPAPPEPPVAVIAGPDEAGIGERVSFSGANSTPGDAPILLFSWNLGNGQTSDRPNPVTSTVYDQAGAYQVSLTVVDRSGYSAGANLEIRIVEDETPGEPPTAVIAGPAEALVGEEVTFQGGNSSPGSSPIVVYSWDFNNTRTFADSPDVSATTVYDAPGTYNPSLTVTDRNGLSDTAVMEITILPGAEPTATPGPEVILPEAIINAPGETMAGVPVFFDGTASRPGNGGNIVDYEWRFGDGSTGSGSAVQHIYSNPGGFEVVLIVTDESGRSNNTVQGILVTGPVQPTPEPTEPPAVPTPAPTDEPGGGGPENQLWSLNGVLPETQITLIFKTGQLGGLSGCNNYAGVYQTSGNDVNITITNQTDKICDQEVMNQESQYLDALQSSTGFEVQGNQLTLFGAQMLTFTLLTR